MFAGERSTDESDRATSGWCDQDQFRQPALVARDGCIDVMVPVLLQKRAPYTSKKSNDSFSCFSATEGRLKKLGSKIEKESSPHDHEANKIGHFHGL